MNRDDILKACSLYDEIYERAAARAEAMGLGGSSISFEATDFDDPDNATFTVEWEGDACRRGCCGTETKFGQIPLSYLWDEEWWKDHQAKEAAQIKVWAEERRQKGLLEAKQKIERAQRSVKTAESKAKAELKKAQAELAALESA